MDNTMYDKYIKYKNKYMKLKNKINGGCLFYDEDKNNFFRQRIEDYDKLCSLQNKFRFVFRTYESNIDELKNHVSESEYEYYKNIMKKFDDTKKEYNIRMNTEIINCVNNIVDTSKKIYEELLNKNKLTTIICCDEISSYYCLSMKNLKIYDPAKVNVIVLPFSKYHSGKYDNILYCNLLKDSNTIVNKNIVIHSNTNSLLLETIEQCFNDVNITQINFDRRICNSVEKNMENIIPSFERQMYDKPELFDTEFTNINNDIAKLIIDKSELS